MAISRERQRKALERSAQPMIIVPTSSGLHGSSLRSSREIAASLPVVAPRNDKKENMITRQQKKEIVEELIDKLSRQKSVIFSDYTGLTVNQVQELRSQLRENNIDYRVAKKTLIDLALDKAGFKDFKIRDLSGQIGLVFSYEDEILPAKIIYDFSRKNETLKMLAGLVQGEYLDSEAIVNLAKLPSKQELLAKLVGGFASPMSGFCNGLQFNLRKLVYLLNILKKSKSEA